MRTIPLLILSALPAFSGAVKKPPVSVKKAAVVRREFPSVDSLVSAAVAKLYAGDTLGVFGMSFNKEEFLKVYPSFESDTSSDRRTFAAGYYLADNQKILLRIMGRECDRPAVLSRFIVEGPLADYKGMVLYKGIRIWVRRGGEESEIRFIKSAARRKSGWKIWSFADD